MYISTMTNKSVKYPSIYNVFAFKYFILNHVIFCKYSTCVVLVNTDTLKTITYMSFTLVMLNCCIFIVPGILGGGGG